jgi:hypothetical protein
MIIYQAMRVAHLRNMNLVDSGGKLRNRRGLALLWKSGKDFVHPENAAISDTQTILTNSKKRAACAGRARP